MLTEEDKNLAEKSLIDNMENGVRKVLSGELEKYESQLLSPSHYEDFLVDEMGAEAIDGPWDGYHIETNGWQWDYWIFWEYKDKKYILSGSGYYPGTTFEEYKDD